MSTRYSRRARQLEYMGWIKTLPCAVCGRQASEYFAIEAAHCGPRVLSQKTDDRNCIPLCVQHHRDGPDSAHVLQRQFEPRHSLDIRALIVRLNAAWELLCRARNEMPWR